MQSEQLNDWMVVNDSVMGGISRSQSEVTSRGTLIFRGDVSLENNGGFASIRHDAEAFDINQGEGIVLRVKGDGNTYQLRLRTSDGFDGMAYMTEFKTLEGEWKEYRLPWDVFTATYRGRLIPDAPKLQASGIRQIGFLIANKQEGPFELEVGTIEAW